MTAGDDTAQRGWFAAIGWGAYLACSWTWCIGMFLPILLVRDFGLWGFFVFAVPNVLGAGAMGWVLRRPGASESICARHGGAIRWFSAVTVAFQIFFMLWLVSGLIDLEGRTVWGGWVSVAVAGLGGLTAIWATARRWRMRTLIGGATLIWALSVSAGVIALSYTDLNSWSIPGRGESIGVFLLAPVCVLGFLACPYLDRTFHLARQSAKGPTGTAAFTLGFGFLFLTMILFTLLYASGTLQEGSIGAYIASGAAGAAVFAHIMTQLVFTIGVHQREMSAPPRSIAIVRGLMLAAFFVVVIFLIDLGTNFGELTVGEVVYRCFMSFYGLVFPAYVWLVMIPTRDGHAGLAGPVGRKKMRVLMFTIGLAAPMYWMGFIERLELWLVAGIAVVLLARLALPSDDRPVGQEV